MKPSEIRSLFAVASRPEIVSLAGGMPNLSAIPMDMMAGIVETLIKRSWPRGAPIWKWARTPAASRTDL